MSYQLSDDAYYRLHQARDAIRLVKHSSLESEQEQRWSLRWWVIT